MIDTLIRPPATRAHYVADGVRVLVVGSMVAAGLFWGPVDLAVFALVLLGCLIARALALPLVVDTATGVMLATAAWSSVLGIYALVGWWDFAMHAAVSGALAGMCYQLLGRGGILAFPPQGAGAAHKAATVFLVLACGAALSVLWEFGEWCGHTYIDAAINVGYRDTLSDLAAGLAGSVVTGVFIAVAGRDERHRPHEP